MATKVILGLGGNINRLDKAIELEPILPHTSSSLRRVTQRPAYKRSKTPVLTLLELSLITRHGILSQTLLTPNELSMPLGQTSFLWLQTVFTCCGQ
jgi:hypothetical protein